MVAADRRLDRSTIFRRSRRSSSCVALDRGVDRPTSTGLADRAKASPSMSSVAAPDVEAQRASWLVTARSWLSSSPARRQQVCRGPNQRSADWRGGSSRARSRERETKRGVASAPTHMPSPTRHQPSTSLDRNRAAATSCPSATSTVGAIGRERLATELVGRQHHHAAHVATLAGPSWQRIPIRTSGGVGRRAPPARRVPGSGHGKRIRDSGPPS